jgi:hypothetical protein
VRTEEENEALLARIPDLVATLGGFGASPEEKDIAAIELRKTLQIAGPVFDAAREATVDADAVCTCSPLSPAIRSCFVAALYLKRRASTHMCTLYAAHTQVPILLQLVYSATDVAEVCWILQLVGASLNPADPCKQSILDEHGVVMLIDVCDRASQSEQARSHCLAALYNLAIGREDLKEVYAQSTELLRAILGDIKDADVSGPQPGLRLLRLMLTEAPEERIAQLANFGMLDAVTSTLKIDGVLTHAQVSALPCLIFLVRGSPDRGAAVAETDAKGGQVVATLAELRKRLLSKATPSLLERGVASLFSITKSGGSGSPHDSQGLLKPESMAASRALTDTENVLKLIRAAGGYPISALETPSNSDDGAASAEPPSNLAGSMWGAIGSRAATLASAKRKLALLGTTAREFAIGTASRKAAVEDSTGNTEPVLDFDDPNEVMMRRVTEKTLRSEFTKAGGRVTPTQIAERFKQSLNDREYGPENRVRFRDVIDRIAIPEVVEENGESVCYLQLRADLPPPTPTRPSNNPNSHLSASLTVDTAT